MAWSTDAARPLTDAFTGTPGTVIAVACIDEAETVIEVNPRDTPANGRFEVGSVTKTMTATLRGVMADTTITFAHGTLGLRIGFVPSGQVSGLSLLAPPR
jgi:hypothetical protein